MGVGWGQILLALAFILNMAAVCAAAGLGANLLWPNLTWTSETVAVKQGMGTMAGMLAPTLLLLALAGLYPVVGRPLGSTAYLAAATAVTAALAAAALWWVLHRGAARWEAL